MRKLKSTFGLLIITSLSFIGLSQSPSFKTYTNPVIPGDHPDPTLTCVGKDFYTSGSSFNPTPVIYHSTDLVHWEVIAQPVKASWAGYGDKPGGGCWGGHLVYYKKQYWDFFSHAGSMWFVKSNDPKGSWSAPVKISNPSVLPFTLGYDNSIFIDDNGKWYMVVKNLQPNNAIVELDENGQANGAVYDLKWLNPAPSFPFSWAEGPVMWKYKGRYYYSFAKNVSGGQWVMSSNVLSADSASWEILGAFYNERDPLKKTAIFQTPNHVSPVITLDDSTSWAITQSYARNEWKGQARQGLLTRVQYKGLVPCGEYPVNTTFSAPRLPSSGIPWMVPKSDFFDSDKLNPEWSFLGYTEDSTVSLTQRPGWLRLSPKAKKSNTIIKIEGEHNYSLITRVDFTPQSTDAEAGLRITRSDEKQFLKLYRTLSIKGKKIIRFTLDSLNKVESENNPGDIRYMVEDNNSEAVWLKLERINHLASGYFSYDGMNWIQVGKRIDVSTIDALSAGWIGSRIGLFVQRQCAFFDLFIYRDAYTPILAECPANSNGTVATTRIDNIFCLDSIHNNDWAMYAGVEFGGRTDYPKITRTFEVTASSASNGGVVEIWLDSIATGKKIAECKIINTGGWNNFKTFSIPVLAISGRHDVYLNFKGMEGKRLFMLKRLGFTGDISEIIQK